MGADDNARADGELIERYLAGDDGAFAALYERYRRPLYGFLNSMLPGRSALVDDMYQQAWLKAIAGLARYQHTEKFLPWLFRIARNLVIDCLRREARVRHVELVEPAVGGTERTPSVELSTSELGTALANAVGELPAELREVFLLRQQEISFKDIAEIQDASINTVLGRMRYAVLRLRKALAEWA